MANGKEPLYKRAVGNPAWIPVVLGLLGIVARLLKAGGAIDALKVESKKSENQIDDTLVSCLEAVVNVLAEK